MKLLFIMYRFFSFIFFIGGAFSAQASCSIDGPNSYSATIGDVSVQRDAPVGSVITKVILSNSNYVRSYSCDGHIVMTYNGAKPTGQDYVYETNLPGVGIKYYERDNAGGYNASPTPGTEMHGGTPYGSGGYILYNGEISLVKTGNVTSGVLTPGEIAQIQLKSLTDAGDYNVSISLSGGSVTQVACSLKTTNIVFHLPDISVNELNALQGPDSKVTASENLGLDCDAGANINMTFTGNQNPDISDNSVLDIENHGEEGIAKGVGVQILYNNVPLKLNQSLVLKKSAGGEESFPLTARYFHTSGQVMPGIANATATLTLTYQ